MTPSMADLPITPETAYQSKIIHAYLQELERHETYAATCATHLPESQAETFASLSPTGQLRCAALISALTRLRAESFFSSIRISAVATEKSITATTCLENGMEGTLIEAIDENGPTYMITLTDDGGTMITRRILLRPDRDKAVDNLKEIIDAVRRAQP